MGRIRLVAVLLAAAASAAGCGAAAPQRFAPGPPRERPGALKAETFRAQAALEAARAAQVRAQIAAARRSRTVDGALRLALLTGAVSPPAYARMNHDWTAAQDALAQLTGTRYAELAAVTATVSTLAAGGQLSPSRLRPMFLILRRNTSFWTQAPLPAPGFRAQFGTDPAVFQYYPGRGLQLQALASWGRANGEAKACLRDSAGARRRLPCAAAPALRRTLDGLLALGSRRSGFLTWEYYFGWAGGTPPWISGMAQATAIQALARGAVALQAPRYARAAQRALGAFEQPPPAGVSVPAPGGRHYLMYSFAPSLRILNGDLQAITGLHDFGTLTGDRTAMALFHAGDRAARRAVRGFDTGAWSLYSDQGDESTLSYHRLVDGFLGNLCVRTHAPVYCGAQVRFARYERQPTRIRIPALHGLRARRPVQVRFALSKVSSVGVRVWSARGTSLERRLSLPRGGHVLTWIPPRRGTFKLRIQARGPSGPVGIAGRTIRVVRPKPKPRARPRHGPKGSILAKRVDAPVRRHGR
jgi:D-glucuronyl C5-epimerase C-terminus